MLKAKGFIKLKIDRFAEQNLNSQIVPFDKLREIDELFYDATHRDPKGLVTVGHAAAAAVEEQVVAEGGAIRCSTPIVAGEATGEQSSIRAVAGAGSRQSQNFCICI